MDDPLPHGLKVDSKQRLHDTIKRLNRDQKAHLIRFHANGTGTGILWEPIEENGIE